MLRHKIEWTEKTAVITGSGSGIGRAVAIALAGKGARVHLVDLRPQRITALLNELPADAAVWGHTIDVTIPSQLKQLATTIEEPIDVLINCAGILHQGKIATAAHQSLHQVMDVNFWGVINSIKAFVPQMRCRKQGSHIINIASIAGLIGAPEMALYNASKFAILGLTESLAIELASENIHVAAVCPGSINTNLCRDGVFSSESTVAQTLRRTVRNGAGPEQVAKDIIQVVERSSLFKLSCVEAHWQFLWWCKRMFPSFYPKLASVIYHKVIDKGILHFLPVFKPKSTQCL